MKSATSRTSSYSLYRLWGVGGSDEPEESMPLEQGSGNDSYIVKLKVSPDRLASAVSENGNHRSQNKELAPVHPFFRKRKKDVNDNNPQSYMVKLKIPSAKLKGIQSSKRLDSMEKYKSNKPIHPFFLKRSEKPSTPITATTKLHDEHITPSPSPHPPPSDKPIHPFFAKRAKPEKSSGPKDTNYFYVKQTPTPWPRIQHVRGLEDHDQYHKFLPLHTIKSKGKKRQKSNNDENLTPIKVDINREKTAYKRSAERLFMKPSQITNLAYESIEKKHYEILNYLLKSVSSLKAFDNHTCDPYSWCMKYAPQSSSEVVTGNNNAGILLNWMKGQIIAAKKHRKREAKLGHNPVPEDLDDFIVDDEDEETEDEYGFPADIPIPKRANYLILHGPPGSGKTSSVYAAGKELNAYIFEINPSSKRSGKELLDVLEGTVKSQLVHSNERNKSQDSVILLEEVDVLYSDERSFWSGLDRLTEISKRPIILTCNDLSTIPKVVLEEKAELLEFHPAPIPLQTDTFFLIALSEGHLVDRAILWQLISSCKQDIRQGITNLQFWCQMGIGGKKSGVDWFITSGERKKLGPVRIVSKGEHIETGNENRNTDTNMTLDDYELSSAADIISNNLYSCFEPPSTHDNGVLETEDKTSMDYTTELPLREYPLPFELQMHQYLRDPSISYNQPDNTKKIKELRDTLYFASFPAQGSGSGTFNSIDCTQGGILSSEIAPFLRRMAKAEIAREREKTDRLASVSNSRPTRRSYAAEYGTTRYNKHFVYCDEDEDLDNVIKSAPLSWQVYNK